MKRKKPISQKPPTTGQLNLEWLEAFLTVVDRHGFARAAVVLGCSQATVSRRVDALEMWLRKPLFKNVMPLQLSREGEEYLETAIKIVDLCYESRAKVEGEVYDITGTRIRRSNDEEVARLVDLALTKLKAEKISRNAELLAQIGKGEKLNRDAD